MATHRFPFVSRQRKEGGINRFNALDAPGQNWEEVENPGGFSASTLLGHALKELAHTIPTLYGEVERERMEEKVAKRGRIIF